MDKLVVNENGGGIFDADLFSYESDRDKGLFSECGVKEGDYVVYQDGEFKGSGSDKRDVEKKIRQMGLSDYSIIRVNYPPTPCLSFHRTFLRH